MAATPTDSDIAEQCDDCNRETPHDVDVTIKTESNKSENAAFSREPYRVSTCRICGASTSIRMNNA